MKYQFFHIYIYVLFSDTDFYIVISKITEKVWLVQEKEGILHPKKYQVYYNLAYKKPLLESYQSPKKITKTLSTAPTADKGN